MSLQGGAPDGCGANDEARGVRAAGTFAASSTPPATAVAPSGMPAVKFCGLCNAEDAEAVNRCAPDYVGFVFWERSKRRVSPQEAGELRALLDEDISTVGVFVDASADFVEGLFRSGVIAVAQLHGEEDERYLQGLRARCPGLEVWKAFVVQSAADVECARQSSADMVLLDAGKGEGATFDWSLLESLDRPFALAGGLNAGNVAHALAHCKPAVVDVSSGIEAPERAADGRTRKDTHAMEAFMRAVREGAQLALHET